MLDIKKIIIIAIMADNSIAYAKELSFFKSINQGINEIGKDIRDITTQAIGIGENMVNNEVISIEKQADTLINNEMSSVEKEVDTLINNEVSSVENQVNTSINNEVSSVENQVNISIQNKIIPH